MYDYTKKCADKEIEMEKDLDAIFGGKKYDI